MSVFLPSQIVGGGGCGGGGGGGTKRSAEAAFYSSPPSAAAAAAATLQHQSSSVAAAGGSSSLLSPPSAGAAAVRRLLPSGFAVAQTSYCIARWLWPREYYQYPSSFMQTYQVMKPSDLRVEEGDIHHKFKQIDRDILPLKEDLPILESQVC